VNEPVLRDVAPEVAVIALAIAALACAKLWLMRKRS